MIPEFEKRLAALLPDKDTLGQAERHLFGSAAAKRVRPRFLLACGQMLHVPTTQLLDAACAVELIHAASLLHDDVVDKATERRALPSVNAAYGNSVAVLAGDRLLTRALLLLTNGPRSQDAVRYAAQTVFAMTEATVLEMKMRHANRISEKQVVSIADGKTGALFGLCGNLAGLAANNDEAADILGKIGSLVGRAFQLRDDIDDIDEDTKDGTPTLARLSGAAVANQTAGKAIVEVNQLLHTFHADYTTEELAELIRSITRSS